MNPKVLRHAAGQSAAPALLDAVLRGLLGQPKRIPSSFLYDARGSALFELITELPEYYPTRTEIAILAHHGSEIGAAIGPVRTIVEFGSGSSRKTELLLRSVRPEDGYVPIEISETALVMAVARLRARFPGLVIRPQAADYRSLESLGDAPCPRLGFFPGSTLGNEAPEAAVDLLVRFARLLGPAGRLLIGIDLRKEPDVIRRAYDDGAGVTAAFNRNLLVRANRELAADFRIRDFRHIATYDDADGRLDMWLESKGRQTVTIGRQTIEFERGERIHTEWSHKYDLSGFAGLADAAGWSIVRFWTDPKGWFAVVLLDRRPERGGAISMRA